MAEHPITPPPELVREWHYEHGAIVDGSMYVDEYIAIQAARRGADQDQELEACIDVILAHPGLEHPELLVEVLRAARRPKPPSSLKEQALTQLDSLHADLRAHGLGTNTDIIRRALERLQELEEGNE